MLFMPLKERGKPGVDPYHIFNGQELYLRNKNGHLLLADGTALIPKWKANGVLDRDADGRILGELVKGISSTDKEPCGVIYARPQMKMRIKLFLFHKTMIIEPRFLLLLLASGGFDTAVYFLGKQNGREEIRHEILHGTTGNSRKEKRVLASNFLPLPIVLPTMEDAGIKNLVSSSADKAGANSANNSSAINASTAIAPGYVGTYPGAPNITTSV